MGIRIICDSACDMNAEVAKRLDIQVLPIKVYFGEKEYLDGVTLNHSEFFEKLIETDELPTTSQLSPYDYEMSFQEALDAGDTVICITISSKLSGCYQSANIAASEFGEDKVWIVDSENVCVGERILVELAARLREEGKTATQIVGQLNIEKKKIRLVALLDTLEYLKKGGRISATVALAGAILSIKPVVGVENGEIVMLGKARGSKNGNNMLMDLIGKEGGIDFRKPICLGYSGQSDHVLNKYIADSKHLYEGNIDQLPVATIGSTIGTHVGPGAIAVAFYKA